jgi:catechol 2,3-dioxygenase-like lactoylglutathione lyase family enzyme
MPAVQRIVETAIFVEDPNRAAAFYKRLFDFNTLLETDRLIALNVAGQSVLLLFKQGTTAAPVDTPGGVIPGHAGSGANHFAFSISAEDVPAWQEHLLANNVPIESQVNWPGEARSIYFRDPDNNLVELITPDFWKLG